MRRGIRLGDLFALALAMLPMASHADCSERMNLYGQAQEVLIQDLPVVPLYNRSHLALTRPYVENLTITAQDEFPGDVFLDQASIASH